MIECIISYGSSWGKQQLGYSAVECSLLCLQGRNGRSVVCIKGRIPFWGSGKLHEWIEFEHIWMAIDLGLTFIAALLLSVVLAQKPPKRWIVILVS